MELKQDDIKKLIIEAAGTPNQDRMFWCADYDYGICVLDWEEWHGAFGWKKIQIRILPDGDWSWTYPHHSPLLHTDNAIMHWCKERAHRKHKTAEEKTNAAYADCVKNIVAGIVGDSCPGRDICVRVSNWGDGPELQIYLRFECSGLRFDHVASIESAFGPSFMSVSSECVSYDGDTALVLLLEGIHSRWLESRL